jgi:hypothetical protein
VFHFVVLGCMIYVTLSGLTWLGVRVLEAALAPPAAQPQQRVVSTWS